MVFQLFVQVLLCNRNDYSTEKHNLKTKSFNFLTSIFVSCVCSDVQLDAR